MRTSQIALCSILAALSSVAMFASANTAENIRNETITPIEIGQRPAGGWVLVKHRQLMEVADGLDQSYRSGATIGSCRIVEISAAYISLPATFWSNPSFYRLSFTVDAGDGRTLPVVLESKDLASQFGSTYWFKKKLHGAQAKIALDGNSVKLLEIENDAGAVNCSNSK